MYRLGFVVAYPDPETTGFDAVIAQKTFFYIFIHHFPADDHIPVTAQGNLQRITLDLNIQYGLPDIGVLEIQVGLSSQQVILIPVRDPGDQEGILIQFGNGIILIQGRDLIPLDVDRQAFSLGCGLEFSMLLKADLPGILLGVLTVFVGGFFNILADRSVGGRGICGASASSTAGNAVADPSLSPWVDMATSQVAAACITSVILTPVITGLVHRRLKKRETGEIKQDTGDEFQNR